MPEKNVKPEGDLPEDVKNMLAGEDEGKQPEQEDVDWKAKYEALKDQYQNLERVLGEQGRELGELRKTFEQLRLKNEVPEAATPEPEPDDGFDGEFVSKRELQRYIDSIKTSLEKALEEKLTQTVYGPEGIIGQRVVEEFKELRANGLTEDQLKAVSAYMSARGIMYPKKAWAELKNVVGAVDGQGQDESGPVPPSFKGSATSEPEIEEYLANFEKLPPERQDEILRRLT